MDNDTDTTLRSRAFEALTAASEAAFDAARQDVEAARRAEHARAAHELAAYARELFAIVREGGRGAATRPDAQPAPDALTEDAWFRTTIAQMSTVHDARVQFSASLCATRDKSTCSIDNGGGYHVLGAADGGDIVEAFARALAQVPGARAILATRPAR